MASSSLENKTVRPGSLGAYSYYHSARRPDHPQTPFIAAAGRRLIPRKLMIAVAVAAALVAVPLLKGDATPSGQASGSQSNTQRSSSTAPSSAAAVVAAPSKTANECAGNGLAKLALVSISRRHMWACEGAKTIYDSPVITGMSAYAATVTPVGTYHIYGKQTDTTLTGSDVTGSWNDPVSYWMPFLQNQYGIYGFHDATWRPNDAFGQVSPDSSDASHGCVELPLATSAWLYSWAPVGTTVTIRS
jgi:L,D-transpeptidase-like protein